MARARRDPRTATRASIGRPPPDDRWYDCTVSDGYSLYGPVDGVPVVFSYGTPGSSLPSPQFLAAADRGGVRLLVPDRPGYGGVPRRPGRSIADVVPDLLRLVDDLGWSQFAVWGGSGGGPHALVAAALLPDRVTRCAAVVSPAPYEADGLDWYAGMSPGNVEEFTLAAKGEAAYRPLVERLAAEGWAEAQAGRSQLPADYALAPSDLAAMEARRHEPGHLDRVRASMVEGVDGWIDDCIAMTRPWGADLTTITVPVSVWYGPDDVLCPRGHTEWLLRTVPGAERHELGGGHLRSDADLDAIIAWLADR